MKNPKVTVPMACYNASKFIVAAIKSLAEQTYTNWELIVVDDGSTDKSLKIVRKCIRELKIEDKVKYYRRDENKGFGYTLREAIAYGDGEIIAPLDADDALANPKAILKIFKT